MLENHTEESIHLKHFRWKVNGLIALILFSVVGQFLVIGSLNQLYRRVNSVESYCTFVIQSEPKIELEEPKPNVKK
jgi:hypothetical protein